MNALNKQMEMFGDLPKQKKVKAAGGGALMATEKGKILPSIAELTDAYNIFRADRDSAKLTVDEMDAILESFLDMKSAGKSFAEGGLEDGGLKDEGGETDPVSGNDVPPGSSKEEVRDDIPAMLSEGEFVFPADVVRYIGLENLMRLRQQAKQGLKMMEAMGQMGNSEDAIMPDDLPFGVTDLIIVDTEDEKEYNEDDVKEMQVGGMATGTNTTTQPGIYYTPSTFPTQQTTQAASSQYQVPSMYQAPTQQATPVVGGDVPQIGQFMEQAQEDGAAKIVTIINPDTLEERQINFIPGVTTIPEGFMLKSKYQPEEKVTTTPTTTQTTKVAKQSDDDPNAMSKEEIEKIEGRIDAAKQLGYDKFANPLSGMVSALVPGKSIFGFDTNLEKGTITGTGFIADGAGGLFDPITGAKVNPSIVQGIVDTFRGTDRNKELGKGSQAKQAGLKSLYDKERDERIQKATDVREEAEERLEKARKESRAAEIREQARMRQEKEAEIAAEKQRIQDIQKRAREQLAQQYGDSDDGGTYEGSVQQQADDYTAQAVAEAVSTGDYSRGFAKGGLAKQMKQSGLASKK